MTPSPRHAVAVAVGALVVLAAAACAAAPVYNPGHAPPQAMRRIQQACAAVVRLPAGSAYDFSVCQESLSRSWAARGGPAPRGADVTATAWPADRRGREQQACAAIGFEPAGLAFGQCVADLDAELRAADRPIM